MKQKKLKPASRESEKPKSRGGGKKDFRPDQKPNHPSHETLSAEHFNKAWELMEKRDRTAEDVREMVTRSHASLWHWMQRPDCKPRNLSIGTWQLARIYSLIGEAGLALDYGRISLEYASPEQPFFAGYAHEAMARAAMIAGDWGSAAKYLREAGMWCDKVKERKAKSMLQKDLELISARLPGKGG